MTNKDDILELIVPDQKEKDDAFKKYQEISAYISEKYNRETILVGSVAKDTFLKGDKDLDIFMFFSANESRRFMESEAISIGKDVFDHYGVPHQIEYAEHPYVSGKIGEYAIEIVPCYKVDSGSDMKSSVDRTPFHLTYVKNNLDPHHHDDVRLLKKFLKSQKLYGAETKINGFSGYLCELLIIHYGTFMSLMERGSMWVRGKVIELNATKKNFSDPLVFVDPVDPNRNVASPVSLDTLSRFVLACNRFLDGHDYTMFLGPEKGYAPVAGGRLLVIAIDVDVLEEIYFAQCRRFLNAIERACGKEGFTIYKSGVFSKGIVLDFELDSLPKMQKHKGPKIGNFENMKNFFEKNDIVFAEKGQLFALKERRFNDVNDIINDIIDKEIGMGNHIKKANITILEGIKAISFLKYEVIYY